MKLQLWIEEDREYLWTEVQGTQVRVYPDTGTITTTDSAPLRNNLLEAVRSLYAAWNQQEVQRLT